MAFQQTLLTVFIQALVFPDGNEFHLRSDNPLPRIMHLRHVAAFHGPARQSLRSKAQLGQFPVIETPAAVNGRQRVKLLGVAPFADPVIPNPVQSPADVDGYGRVRIWTGGIVHRHGRIFFRTRGCRCVTAMDFPHGHADIIATSLHMDLSGIGKSLNSLGINTGFSLMARNAGKGMLYFRIAAHRRKVLRHVFNGV